MMMKEEVPDDIKTKGSIAVGNKKPQKCMETKNSQKLAFEVVHNILSSQSSLFQLLNGDRSIQSIQLQCKQSPQEEK